MLENMKYTNPRQYQVSTLGEWEALINNIFENYHYLCLGSVYIKFLLLIKSYRKIIYNVILKAWVIIDHNNSDLIKIR